MHQGAHLVSSASGLVWHQRELALKQVRAEQIGVRHAGPDSETRGQEQEGCILHGGQEEGLFVPRQLGRYTLVTARHDR